jgi:hypothetical protein
MKSALAAFLSLVAGAILGYFAYSFLGPNSGRDIWPVLGIAAFPMFLCGLVSGAFWMGTLRSTAAGVLGYALVVAGVVAYFGGGTLVFLLLGNALWIVFFATMLPWLFGALLGRYVLRPSPE